MKGSPLSPLVESPCCPTRDVGRSTPSKKNSSCPQQKKRPKKTLLAIKILEDNKKSGDVKVVTDQQNTEPLVPWFVLPN